MTVPLTILGRGRSGRAQDLPLCRMSIVTSAVLSSIFSLTNSKVHIYQNHQNQSQLNKKTATCHKTLQSYRKSSTQTIPPKNEAHVFRATTEAIQSYVYALADDQDRIFYVGKGKEIESLITLKKFAAT